MSEHFSLTPDDFEELSFPVRGPGKIDFKAEWFSGNADIQEIALNLELRRPDGKPVVVRSGRSPLQASYIVTTPAFEEFAQFGNAHYTLRIGHTVPGTPGRRARGNMEVTSPNGRLLLGSARIGEIGPGAQAEVALEMPNQPGTVSVVVEQSNRIAVLVEAKLLDSVGNVVGKSVDSGTVEFESQVRQDQLAAGLNWMLRIRNFADHRQAKDVVVTVIFTPSSD
jgi:hypothetical protein